MVRLWEWNKELARSLNSREGHTQTDGPADSGTKADQILTLEQGDDQSLILE